MIFERSYFYEQTDNPKPTTFYLSLSRLTIPNHCNFRPFIEVTYLPVTSLGSKLVYLSGTGVARNFYSIRRAQNGKIL